jgi:hypothetical protein
MTKQESAHDRQALTTSRTGGPLACFGVNESAARLYFVSLLSNVTELAKTNNDWKPTDTLFSAAPNSPLTGFGLEGTFPRVYYFDVDSRIHELAWRTSQWTFQTLPGQPADDSPLTCVGSDEGDCYLYYVGTDRRVHELAADTSGNFQEQTMPGASVAPGSGLTCSFHDFTPGATVFYTDDTGKLHYTGYYAPDQAWESVIKEAEPAPGSALTCFDIANTDDNRVYYLDAQNRINEMAWTGDTKTNNRLDYTAMPGSALTCFGVEGQLTRLYYLDDQAQVNELAWKRGQHGAHGHWGNNPLGYTAAPDSALTCFGVEGKWTRLYYLDPDHRINELAWDPNTETFGNTAL